MIVQSKYFGEINTEQINEAYDFFQPYGQDNVFTILVFEDAFFSDKKITVEDVKLADKMIDNRQLYIDIATQAIEQSFQDKSIAYTYLEHHAQYFELEELQQIGVHTNQEKLSLIQQLKEKIYFTSYALDPTAKVDALSLDFTISKELTQFVIVVRMTKDGVVNDIDIES